MAFMNEAAWAFVLPGIRAFFTIHCIYRCTGSTDTFSAPFAQSKVLEI